jgi:hypothetical protein
MRRQRRQPDDEEGRRKGEREVQMEREREEEGKRERERERERERRGDGTTFSSDALKKRLTPLYFSRTACRGKRECPGFRLQGSDSGLCMTSVLCGRGHFLTLRPGS